MIAASDVVLTAFRKCWYWDATTGRPGTVAEYQALFPGHEKAVAEEFERLSSQHSSSQDARAAEKARVGPYRLDEFLGRGGQGAVYAATDSRTGRKVALKVLAAEAGSSERRLLRLRREAEAVARIDHPGICGIHEAGLDGDVPYLALHYVPGRTLADAVGRARRDNPSALGSSSAAQFLGLPAVGDDDAADRAALFFEKAARAVHAAHEAGLVHRDVKPANLMVTPEGDPVVLDFGLARDEEEGRTITRTGAFLGTPAYMAPEQTAQGAMRLDRRADVYALGLCLFEALTLLHPFEAPTNTAAARAGLLEARSLREVDPRFPRDLAVVVATALRRDRERRYRTALALAEDLRAFRARRPIRARPPGPVERLAEWARRRPALAASGAVAFVTLSAGLAVSLTLLASTRDALSGQTAAKEAARASRASANKMVEYLLGDLQRALAKVGNTDLLVAISSKAKAHFDGIALEDLSDEERATVADAWASLGSAYELQAKRDEQIFCREKALAIREDLYARGPDVPAYARALADSLFALGRRESNTSRYEESIRTLSRAHELMRGLAGPLADDPNVRADDAEIVRTIGGVHRRLGRVEDARKWLRAAVAALVSLCRDAPDEGAVLERTNLAALDLAGVVDCDEARRTIDDALARARTFTAAHPDDPFGTATLADVLARESDQACDRGDGPAAESCADEARGLYAKLLGRNDSKMGRWRNCSVKAGERLCRASLLRGKFAEALDAGAQAVKTVDAERRAQLSSEGSSEALVAIASVHRTYASALHASGATDAALEQLADAGRTVDRAVAVAPDDVGAVLASAAHRTELGATLADAAERSAGSSDPDARAKAAEFAARARAALDEADAVSKRGLEAHPESAAFARRRALVLREVARVRAAAGDSAGAVAALEEAVRVRDGLAADDDFRRRLADLDGLLAAARAKTE